MHAVLLLTFPILIIFLYLLGVFNGCLSKFVVDARAIDTTGDEPVSTIIKAPDGRRFASNIVNKHDGTYLVTYSAIMEGNSACFFYYSNFKITRLLKKSASLWIVLGNNTTTDSFFRSLHSNSLKLLLGFYF